MNIALIGLGYWGPNLLRNLNSIPCCNITAFDCSKEKTDNIKGKFPNINIINNSYVFTEDDIFDAVVIATPPHTHFLIAKNALETGHHVFVEKPITTNSDDAEILCELAETKNLTLMVGHTFLFVPEVREIKKILDSGQIGELLHIESNRKNLGKFQDSGVVWDLAPHDIAMLYYFTNLKNNDFTGFVESSCHVKTDIEDMSTLFMVAKDRPLSYQLNLSWLHPLKSRTTYFVGSRQMLIYDMMAKNKVLLVDRHVNANNNEYHHIDGAVTTVPIIDEEEPLQREMKEFIAACNGADNISNGRLGLMVVQTIQELMK